MRATPIPCTMAPAKKRPRRTLSDVLKVPRPMPRRPFNLLAALAMTLQAACKVSDADWHLLRTRRVLAYRRAVAVTLRRLKLPGHSEPPSYPEIAAAMGKTNHSVAITLCGHFHRDKEAMAAADWMQVMMEREGYGMWPMAVVYQGRKRAPHPTHDQP